MLEGSTPPADVDVGPVMTGVVGDVNPGGTETSPPSGHQDGAGGHVGPELL